jgi:hypothetical protein
MKANVIYRVGDGEILGGSFGPIREPGAGEAVVQLDCIPDPELYYIGDGQAVRRADEDVAARRAQAEELEHELTLARLHAELTAAQAEGLGRAEAHLTEAINALSAG